MKKSRSEVPPLVASINAQEGHGKTTFLLTGKKPLSLFHIDPNTEEIVNKAVKEGDIDESDVTLYPVEYPASIFGGRDEIQDDAEKAWGETFLDPLREVLDDDDVATIGLDTGTELFELLMMADHGKTIQILPELRTKTNYKFKGLLQALKRSKKHIIILHRVRDVWATTVVQSSKGEEEQRNKVPGVYEREGFNKVGYHVNVEAYLSFSPSRGGTIYNQYGIRVSRCTQRPSLVTRQPDEKQFWNLDDDAWWWGRKKLEDGTRVRRASFTYLAMQVFPGTTVEDWS